MEARIFSFLENQKQCTTFEQSWEVYLRELKACGIEHALYGYSLHLDDEIYDVNNNIYFITNYPKGYLEAVEDEGLWDHDFATEWCAKNDDALRWDYLEKISSKLTPLQQYTNNISLDFNLIEGYTIPLYVCGGAGIGGVGMSATGIGRKEFQKDIVVNFPYIETITMLFHAYVQKFPRFTKQYSGNDRVLNLSKMELDVLRYVRKGHIIKEIEAMPGMKSRKTIENCINRARRSLRADSRDSLIAKLMVCGVLADCGNAQ